MKTKKPVFIKCDQCDKKYPKFKKWDRHSKKHLCQGCIDAIPDPYGDTSKLFEGQGL